MSSDRQSGRTFRRILEAFRDASNGKTVFYMCDTRNMADIVYLRIESIALAAFVATPGFLDIQKINRRIVMRNAGEIRVVAHIPSAGVFRGTDGIINYTQIWDTSDV